MVADGIRQIEIVMRYEHLLEPVNESEPSGPDLDEAFDEDYTNYIFSSEERLPQRFFNDGVPFDRSSINAKDESALIGLLLQRSRDLRLLTLEAKFHILAGDIIAFCDCIDICAGLTEKFWSSVHPGADGDFTLRQNTLESFDSQVTCVLPMQFATSVRDRREGVIRLRDYTVAKGDAEPIGDETAKSPAAITDALGSAANSEAVLKVHEALLRGVEGCGRIRKAFGEHLDYEQAPSFEKITNAMQSIISLLEESKPDLRSSAPDAVEDEPLGEVEEEDLSQQPEDGGSTPANPVFTGSVQSHGQARAALAAVEAYFAKHEPTAPTMLLVHQSRVLIGQPLVRAMELLMPQSVDRATINLDTSLNLALGIDRLRGLSEEVVNGEVSDDTSAETFTVAGRSDAIALISAVESFFRQAEPSSPIPMLLQKARGYSNRDFASIVADLIPARAEE